MGQVFNYLVFRSVVNIREFLWHWYVGSFLKISHHTLNILESLDRDFAVMVNLRNLRKPMYQDSSILGHILGFIFRVARISSGFLVYAFVIAIIGVFYIAWLALPPFFLYQAFINYGR